MSKQKKNSQPDQPSPPDPSQNRDEPLPLVFDRQFLEDLTFWVETNRKIAVRLLMLVEEVGRTPFEGTGKPERLKYQSGNVWSRRLTDKDRVVYLVTSDRIEFLQARYHYDDH